MLLTILVAGCASQRAPDALYPSYRERAHAQSREGLIVEAAALNRDESRAVFGAPLNDINIQPVWLRIISYREDPQWLFPIEIDHDYFPTYEVARRAAPLALESPEALYERIEQQHLQLFIPPRESVSGFVFAHSDEGMKAFNVSLHSPIGTQDFSFVVPVPGLPTTYFAIDDNHEKIGLPGKDLDLPGLRNWLERLDCCTHNAEGRAGDPLNLVFVGTLQQLRNALISQHWDVTAPVSGASLRRMVSAFLFGSRYRYAPISSLYVLGREQDMAFQKARAIIDERNHMRIWLAPVTFQGTPVWLGQVSRDVGVKLSGRLWPPTTHVIDPDIDDARFYLIQNLLAARRVKRLGFARGHAQTSTAEPHYNAEDDPYFTDGLRAVLFLSEGFVHPAGIRVLDWELPPDMEPYRAFYLSEE